MDLHRRIYVPNYYITQLTTYTTMNTTALVFEDEHKHTQEAQTDVIRQVCAASACACSDNFDFCEISTTPGFATER
jgi:hypothetical protein